ncbi:MAG TPA: Wzz/FepE/Etk N-terminal domain-containing protein [Bryobacteraceae bacterium]|nr:Wzz/FepE/Etk N-terminal domain-containing protein [Bryobacteraceae bacterium]
MYQSPPTQQAFDAFEYVDYFRRRWRVMAVSVTAAALLAGGISLLLPKKYTATASIVIEPPGGSDARLTTAVSQMYLESLKAYELYGNSPTLFAQADAKFHLRSNPEQSLDSLQRRVLKVAKLRDTKVLQVSATLNDPKQAQALAQYIAEETVNMNHRESLASDRDYTDLAEKQAAEAQQRVAELQKSWDALVVSEPVESLQSEIDAAVDLREKVEEQRATAESDVAEFQQQAQDGAYARQQWNAAQARAAQLGKRSRELQETIDQKTSTLALRTAKRGALEASLKVARKDFETISARLVDSRATAGTHAEQLRIIDPGTVPQRPSAPNPALNVVAAVFAALILSIGYLTFAFVFSRRIRRYERPFTSEDADDVTHELRI